MNPTDPFFCEIVDTLAEIEYWLSGRAGNDALAPLLARFADAFSMISLSGDALDRAQIERFFRAGFGARPGLRIAIDEVRPLCAWDGGAALAYREIQTHGAGEPDVRRSTVVFERDDAGRIRWLRLHETAATP
ncbi:DUF4440 domain-containing protein [Lysobacter enzymogenes]|uniref:DUF4440 domain-containing protein n=1 Tax=Lysobacter enzymogenes TaxID=69 RepID=UPI0038505185